MAYTDRPAICAACDTRHPTLKQRRERGEEVTDRELTCNIALREGISYAEAAA